MDNEEKPVIPHLEFAATIVGVSIDKEYDISTTLNGLAIATAAVLIDTVIGEDGTFDEAELEKKVSKYVSGLGKAVKFAKEQIDVYGNIAEGIA